VNKTLLKSFGYWILALALISLCLLASRWQLAKGLDLNHKNQRISAAEIATPTLDPQSVDPIKDQWRRFILHGTFTSQYSLLKNRYYQGVYGFEVLQNFSSKSLGVISVNRGWVKAGANAEIPPVVSEISNHPDEILIRVRSEFLSRRVSGSLFALPQKSNPQKEIYFDLLEGQFNKPLTPIELPDLSTGPHFAYALQWFFFALCVLVARILISKKLNRKTN